MAKSTIGCISGAMLIASLALNVALMTGCVGIVDGDFPYIHFISKSSYDDELVSKVRPKLLKEEHAASRERLLVIAKEVGSDPKGIDDPVVLKGEIMQRLLDGRVSLPNCEFNKDDLARIEEELISKKSEVKAACEFVMKLKGKKVLVLGAENK